MAMIGWHICWIDRELNLTPWNPCVGHLAERVKFYNILSVSAAGVYWMTWCSPTKCHIQTGIINVMSHGYAMNCLNWCCLKILFHFKNDQVFLAYSVYYRHATDRDRVYAVGAVCLRAVLLLTVLSQKRHFCLVCYPVVKVNGQVFFQDMAYRKVPFALLMPVLMA